MDRRPPTPADAGDGAASHDPLELVARVTAALAGLIGLGALTGWLLGASWSATWGAQMPAALETAIATVLLSVAALARGRLARAAAAAAVLVALASTLPYLTGSEPWWSWPGAAGETRMALHTALGMMLLGAADLVAARHRRPTADAVAAVVLALGGAGLLGYAYDQSRLYAVGPSGSTMSLPVSVVLLLLALSLAARSPHGTATWLVHGRDAGALLMRRLLPVVLVLVPLTGLLVILGENAGWYGPATTKAMTVISAMALLFAVSVHTARRLSLSDERRLRALTALTWVNADLAERIQDRAAELEAERSRVEVYSDRQRIAADMHDHVIQGLFAVALRLDSAARTVPEPRVIREAVTGIDEAIRELRTTIFELKHPATSGTLLARLEKIVGDVRHTLPVTFTHEGAFDLVDDATAEQLVAAAREALSNAVRHSGATAIEVGLRTREGWLVLGVTDNGTGIRGDGTAPSGTRNMRHRAERLDGTCTWSVPAGGGTTVTWQVPCRVSARPAGTEIESTEPRIMLSESLAEALLECARVLATSPADSVVHDVALVVERFLDADHVSVGVAAPEDKMRLVLATGMPTGPSPVGMLASREATLSGYVMVTGEPLKVDDLARLPASLRLFGRLPFGAALMTPVGEPSYATLALARSTGSEPFSREELRDATILARYVALAMERAGLVPAPEVLRAPRSFEVLPWPEMAPPPAATHARADGGTGEP